MNAVFASMQNDAHGETSLLLRVYDAQTRARLETLLSFAETLTDIGQIKTRGDLRGVEYMFTTWGAPRLGVEEIRAYFPSLKAVFYAAGSVRYFAEPYIDAGVRVFSAADANAIPVIEYTLAQILLANKGFFQSARMYSSGRHGMARAHADKFPGNYGCAVGIIGAGKIGGGVIRALGRHCFKVYVYDAFISQTEARELGAELVSLEELFEKCFIISNHLADNAQTKNMLRYEHFSRMDPYGVFINTGRGAQVSEGDLAIALMEEPGRTAVLDVTEPEPVREGHSFYNLGNVFLTPHIAGSAGGEVARMGEYMADAFEDVSGGKVSVYEVTRAMLKIMA